MFKMNKRRVVGHACDLSYRVALEVQADDDVLVI